MEEINLNYRYRFPRVKFRNGETKYGMIFGIYNKTLNKLEYFFASSSDIRKADVDHMEVRYNWVRKLQNRVSLQDILHIEYLN